MVSFLRLWEGAAPVCAVFNVTPVVRHAYGRPYSLELTLPPLTGVFLEAGS